MKTDRLTKPHRALQTSMRELGDMTRDIDRPGFTTGLTPAEQHELRRVAELLRQSMIAMQSAEKLLREVDDQIEKRVKAVPKKKLWYTTEKA